MSIPARPVWRSLARRIAFVRHLRPGQMARRLRLTATRPVMLRFGRHWRGLRPPPATRPVDDPPQPLLSPRQGRIRVEGDGWRFTFLNRSHHLAAPLDWAFAERPATPDRQLWQMNLHYMEYLEEVDDPMLVLLVGDWITRNPPYAPGSWRTSWNSYALSIRTVVWMQQLARRRGLRAEFVAAAITSLAIQIAFLARNLETDVLGNHLIKNLKALLWAGAFFEGPAAAAWRALGVRHLAAQLDEQILADGVHYERSPSYHCQVFADLLECHQVLAGHPLRARLAQVLARMATATADLLVPDSGPPLFNDAGLAMAYPPQVCLEAFARLFGAAPSPRRHLALTSAGYFGLRSGDHLFLADCGAIAPDFLVAHGHGDILSFEWTVAGARLIVDPGVYQYSAGERRAAARSTASHNTVTVGDGEQCDFFGAFRCGRRAHARVLRHEVTGTGAMLEGTHDGFDHLAGRPRHVRRFEVTPTRVAIDDRVEGGAGQAVRARLLVHPDWWVETTGRGAVLSCGPRRVRLEARTPVHAEPAVWWPDLGVERATTRLVIDHGPAPTQGWLTLRLA